MRRVLGASLAAALVLGVGTASAQQFRRPTECSDCIANWYYFDEGGRDWNCMGSYYDGHRGSDFSLRGGNGAIDTGYQVVSVAEGDVVVAHDGEYDHCTACSGSMCGTAFGFGYGNYVVINHGSRKTIYAHMRTGSIRVGVGDHVTCGQVVGDIASSGCSTGAHVHLETRPIDGAYTTAYDNFTGPCSGTASPVFVDQGPWRGLPSAACDGSPPPPTCPAGTYTIWTCNAARTSRRRCIAGVDETDACAFGCISMPVGTDDVCAGGPGCPSGTYAIWTCNADRTARRRCIDGRDETEACAAGCTVMPVGVDDVCAPPADGDGDGYSRDVDCDDGDAARHPGATELCGDGVDQDCSGADDPCPGTDAGSPPGTDAGVVPGRDGAVAPGIDGNVPPRVDGASVDAGPRGGGGSGGVDGGCACRAGGSRGSPRSAVALALPLGVAVLWRSRARRRRAAARP